MRTPSTPYFMGIVSDELTLSDLLGGPQATNVTGLALVYPPTVVKETLDLFGISFDLGDPQFRYTPPS
jgi:hypothetical protein